MYILDITVQKDLIYMIEPMFTYKASHLYIYISIYILFNNGLKYWAFHLYAPTRQPVYLNTLEQFCTVSYSIKFKISLSVAATQQRFKPFSRAFCPAILFLCKVRDILKK